MWVATTNSGAHRNYHGRCYEMSEIDDAENRGASTGEWKQLNLIISSVNCRSKHKHMHYFRSSSEKKSTIWQGIFFFPSLNYYGQIWIHPYCFILMSKCMYKVWGQPFIVFRPLRAVLTPADYTRSPFVTLLPRRAQYGRWSSFGKRVWFTESHLVLIISFLFAVLFTQFILDIK